MERVVVIGGYFLRAKDPAALGNRIELRHRSIRSE
jgi:hypothetical protein